MPFWDNFDIKKITLAAVWTLLVLAAVVSSSFLLHAYSESATIVVTESVQVVDVSYGEEEWIPELPVRLVIPAIEVDAEVQYVGLAESGTGEMAVPDNFTDVGWYAHGIRPGMKGSAVMAGHFNGKKTPQAVFYDLHTLEAGDEVIIMSADRIEDIFYVVRVETYDYDAATTDVFVSTDGKKRLNLITCGGDWMPDTKLYNKRTVVFTELLTDVE